MYIIIEWLNRLWDWFWYFRRGKIKYHVFYFGGNNFMATASNGKCTVWNCYGSNHEAAKEMALYRLRRANSELEGNIKQT